MVVWAAGCASEGFPPGGPEDRAPPAVVETSPADRAVNASAEQAVRLMFDEPLDDRQLRELPRLIRVNPDQPDFDITLDEDTIVLTPQAALVTGVTYAVTVLPGLQDREGNRTVTDRTILFSVGGEEPITLSVVRATIVRDTTPAAGAFYRLENTDLDFGYDAVADSQGQVTLESVAYGAYVATTWLEEVSPGGWQPTEEPGARDSFQLSLDERAHEAIYHVAVVDTSPPAIALVETPTTDRIVLAIDDSLARPPLPEEVRLFEGPEEPDVPLDSLPAADARVRRIVVTGVEAIGPNRFSVRPAELLRAGRVYRIELVGVRNEGGLPANPAGGRTFRAMFTGPRVVPSEPLPWVEGAP